MMRASDLKIGQRFIANDEEFICCGPCDNGLILAAEASGKGLTGNLFTPEYTVKLKPLDALERFVDSVTLPPLPEGYELAPDDHVLDGDSYRIDGCLNPRYFWQHTTTIGYTAKEFKSHWPTLEILAVARRKKQEPRYRPYNTDEMRSLVGKIVVCCEGDHHLVTDWDAEDDSVYIADGYYDAAEMFSEYSTPDGKPCGVAE